MNDQATKLQPAMVHVDLSNIVPASAYNYLSAFLPGIFFEISVLLGNPAFVGKIAANLAVLPISSPYTKLAAILFVAFAIGNGFMMGVSLIQWIIGRAYGIVFSWRQELTTGIWARFLTWVITRRAAGKRSSPTWLHESRNNAVSFSYQLDEETKNLNGCLGILTAALLQSKYAIDRDEFGHIGNWQIFYATLAKPTSEEVRGETWMIATHAAGWSGLVATGLASSLQNRYYISFCVLMIVVGLIHDYYLAKNRYHPILNRLQNIRGMLREFEKLPRSDSLKKGFSLGTDL